MLGIHTLKWRFKIERVFVDMRILEKVGVRNRSFCEGCSNLYCKYIF